MKNEADRRDEELAHYFVFLFHLISQDVFYGIKDNYAARIFGGQVPSNTAMVTSQLWLFWFSMEERPLWGKYDVSKKASKRLTVGVGPSEDS